ncbi:Zn-dependent hydrolase [Roseateles aquatilis]|uniref:Zn-dependent hydrolase n=1 Tax=Roseateles aquatilis TaxID=431061 RepID=A0A246JM68_9BURK|nr:hydantoinase/carbamoylase family amidase [Roseateles aquatilis]OWQ93707.1 Zn-dependent hydrolase [Roseateles aquatilis]
MSTRAVPWASPVSKSAGGSETLFAAIAEATRDGPGVTRESYGSGEDVALALLERHGCDAGLACERDRAGNLWLSSIGEDRDDPAIVIGSHVDSVPRGGNYDGLAGVVAGLAVLEGLKVDLPRLPPLRVLALRGEESAWYGRAYAGSLALLGRLPSEALTLRHRDRPETLGEAMARCGADVAAIGRRESLLPHRVAAYLELHIEQGPVMVARGWPVAAVTGIRGNVRHNRVRCLGEAGHSGAVPRWLRHDAMLAVAQLLARMDEHWRVLLQMGMDLVMTAGICNTPPQSHAVSVIPGEVVFSFEARSQDAGTLSRFHALMRDECSAIATERGVRFEFDEALTSTPATMDEEWLRRFETAAERSGHPIERMPSGAGHDAAVFAAAGIPSAMLFVRNDHGSHNPREAMDLPDFEAARHVLQAAIASLSERPVTAP